MFINLYPTLFNQDKPCWEDQSVFQRSPDPDSGTDQYKNIYKLQM